jgi:hypothetical protein
MDVLCLNLSNMSINMFRFTGRMVCNNSLKGCTLRCSVTRNTVDVSIGGGNQVRLKRESDNHFETVIGLNGLARPERFELPTPWFEARYSIQLSYGRVFLACLATTTTPSSSVAILCSASTWRRLESDVASSLQEYRKHFYPLRAIRLSPTRMVSFSLSKCSRSGIMNLRERPVSSRNSLGVISPVCFRWETSFSLISA